MIYVFLNNKLIAIDTALPLIQHLTQRLPQLRIVYLAFDEPTYRAIRENTIIAEVVEQTGTLRLYARPRAGRFGRILNRLRILALILKLCVFTRLGSAMIFHFKALDTWPFKAVFLANRARTYLLQGVNFALHEWEWSAAKILAEREYPDIKPSAGRLVGYDSEWQPLSDPRLANVERFIAPRPFQLASWHRFLRGQLQQQLHHSCPGIEPRDGAFGVFILSSMDRAALLTDPDSFPELFTETLDCLEEANPDLPILIKPHPATRPALREMQDSILRDRSDRPLYMVHLHPLLLAMYARFFVGNIFSSTFVFAHSMGVRTIEYTDYGHEMMDVTGGRSMNPDLVSDFINRDRDHLLTVLRQPAAARSAFEDLETNAGLEALVAELGQRCPAPGAG